jgi:hypothetical protein
VSTLAEQAVIASDKLGFCFFSESQVGSIGRAKSLLRQALGPFASLLQVKCDAMANLLQCRKKVFPLGEIVNGTDFDIVDGRDNQHQVARADVAQDQLDGVCLQANAYLGLIVKGPT